MLFNSFVYIFLFLPLALLAYFAFNRWRLTTAATGWLVLCSLFFYSWWNPAYLGLLMASLLVNFALGTALCRSCGPGGSAPGLSRKLVLAVGISLNLMLLGIYKYADFFLANLNLLLPQSLPLPHLALPLAISFFTFQQVAYLMDSYRGGTREYDFLGYCLFVTFFPQLIAGPIVHHGEMMPQFARLRARIPDWRNIAVGLFTFALGLFKKVVIADSFAVWAGRGFDGGGSLEFFAAWRTSLSYTAQLYFDFSGYTDMAIGSALLFNIHLPLNFSSPYRARTIQDFWRRWHMTLSRFLRDYVYIPLGGSRHGEARTLGNLMLTFVLGGLWHGAGWTFVFWGFLHGAALCVQRLWGRTRLRLPAVLAWAVTFLFVNAAWVFFRAPSWDDALRVLSGMCGLTGAEVPRGMAFLAQVLPVSVAKAALVLRVEVLLLVAAAVADVAWRDSNEWRRRVGRSPYWGAATGVLFGVSVLFMMFENRVSEFLYFQF